MDFSKAVSDVSPNNKLAKKHGAAKIKTAQIMKSKGNQYSVLKKPYVLGVGLTRNFLVVIHIFIYVSMYLSSYHVKVTEALCI